MDIKFGLLQLIYVIHLQPQTPTTFSASLP
jgi:hypothetical protein